MSTFGMYDTRSFFPLEKFNNRYRKKKTIVSNKLTAGCSPFWDAAINCFSSYAIEVRQEVCEKYMLELDDCLEYVNDRKKQMKAARFSLGAFMRGKHQLRIPCI